MLLPEPERPVVAIVVGLALNSLKFGRRMATGRAPAAANSMSWWGFTGAGNGVRTRDFKLGKLALYQLSYARKVNPLQLRHINTEIYVCQEEVDVYLPDFFYNIDKESGSTTVWQNHFLGGNFCQGK